VREALANVDFESLYGRVRFNKVGQISLPQTVIQVQNEKVVPIYGQDFLSKPLYPMLAWDKR